MFIEDLPLFFFLVGLPFCWIPGFSLRFALDGGGGVGGDISFLSSLGTGPWEM